MDTYTPIPLSKEEILNDYRIAVESREVSELGYKEVFMGKAKFGIFGGGKEVPQIALAHFFKNGDFRSGYYRDQTMMMAMGALTAQQQFAQLYAHADLKAEPVSGGRLMNGHFGTQSLNEDGSWKELTLQKNSSTDISPTASQMPRLVGLAYASKMYRENPELADMSTFSINGNEIAWGTIGNASTSEGLFFETVNAGGVLQIPMIISVWDDEYGISVPAELQTTKGDISAVLAGFQRDENGNGYEIIRVKGWDYPALLEAYAKAEKISREEHVPVLVHVIELAQVGGHSTSGSHTRYKSEERLQWEEDYDCNKKFREWILDNGVATAEELETIEKKASKSVKEARNSAWKAFTQEIKEDNWEADRLLKKAWEQTKDEHAKKKIAEFRDEIKKQPYPIRRDGVRAIKRTLRYLRNEDLPVKEELQDWNTKMRHHNHIRYSSSLYGHAHDSALKVKHVPAQYSEKSPKVNGFEIIQRCFEEAFRRDPRILAFGEDVGKIGDVNQGFAGLQEKFGELRVTDTGIRECTMVGQAIGLAMRGLRPVVEIQYVDYLLYALQIMSDDMATLQYRSHGTQKAPVIVRTRGHRLEGVWHSGSPMGTILHAVRGIYFCVPRNMVQASGFYNTLLKGSDPALVVECLNGYRLKETVPDNMSEFTLPLGVPEVLREGTDVTIVTYGSMCRICLDGAKQLEEVGISAEVIDVQTLLPFDVNKMILESLKKTNRILFADEDVPGGTTAYMMQEVLEKQGGYRYLDSQPKTISSWAHRPAYATDGDYFSKPNPEDIFDAVYDIMHEAQPADFKVLYPKGLVHRG